MNKNIKKCYYCLKEFKSGKSSKGDHVIPDALGGTLSFLNVCPKCNTQLNDKIDAHLVKSYSIYANMFGIRPQKNKKGTNPVRFDEFYIEGIDNNLKAEMISNKVRLREDVIETTGGERIFIAPNQKVLEKKMKSGKKLPFDRCFVPNNKVGMGVGTLEVNAGIMLRALYKICVNFIGVQKGADYLQDLKIEGLKNFIMTGDNPSGKFKRIKLLEEDEYFRKERHHGIKIKKEGNVLVGLVLMFNILEKVLLCDNFTEGFEEIEYYERYY